MASAADRFTRLQKLAIFLIALGQARTREILADVDVDTLQHLNEAIAGLGQVSAAEKAAVMLEFAHFFYEDEPLTGKESPPVAGQTKVPGTTPKPQAAATPPRRSPPRRSPPRRGDTATPPAGKSPGHLELSSQKPALSDEEQAILQTLDKLRRKVDPGQIDWGRAGYDFGEGFKGPEGGRR